LSTKNRVVSAKAELNRAEIELSNSQAALVKWLLPDDAQAGEKIAIWYGDDLIQVTVHNSRDPYNADVQIRRKKQPDRR
jgi:hypothetical protein